MTGFSPSTSVFTCLMLHTHIHIYVVLTRRTNGRSLRTFQKTMFFRKSGNIGQIKTFTSSFLCLQVNVELLLRFSSCCRILRMQPYRFKFLKINLSLTRNRNFSARISNYPAFSFSFYYCPCQKDERMRSGNLVKKWCAFILQAKTSLTSPFL
jgi:hypothetical protein